MTGQRVRSYGTPGASAAQGGASWAVSEGAARVGANAEIATARMLQDMDFLAERGCVVMHDLRIPRNGVTANVDHVVISGNQVHILDTKQYRPGFMWTVAGHSFSGMKSAPYADKQTIPMAREIYNHYLYPIGAEVGKAFVVVRSSGDVSTWALSVPGAKVVSPEVLEQKLSKLCRKPADELLVARMHVLLHTPGPTPTLMGSRSGTSSGPQRHRPAGTPQGGQFMSPQHAEPRVNYPNAG